MSIFKADEEYQRMMRIFDEIEAAEREPIATEDSAETEETTIETEPMTEAAKRLANADFKTFVGNVRSVMNDHAFKTKWEKELAKRFIALVDGITGKDGFVQVKKSDLSAMKTELNLLRNFTQMVRTGLDKL